MGTRKNKVRKQPSKHDSRPLIEDDPNWWCGNSLRISEHAIDRARERSPKSIKKLSQRMLGSLLAGAIYNPRGKPLVLAPDKDNVYQVALPFFNAKDPTNDKPIGYVIIAPDEDEPEISVCKTFLEPDSWQLHGREGLPIPLWYLRFKERI